MNQPRDQFGRFIKSDQVILRGREQRNLSLKKNVEALTAMLKETLAEHQSKILDSLISEYDERIQHNIRQRTHLKGYYERNYMPKPRSKNWPFKEMK